VETAVLVVLGLYWLGSALYAGRLAETRWVWAIPFVLSIDNITYGLIDHAWSSSVAVQAIEQLISSSLLALIGLVARLLCCAQSRAQRSAALLSRPRPLGLRASSRHRSCSRSADPDGNYSAEFCQRSPGLEFSFGRRWPTGAGATRRSRPNDRRPVVLVDPARPPAPPPRPSHSSITSRRLAAATPRCHPARGARAH
jgi:hypothetical protein